MAIARLEVKIGNKGEAEKHSLYISRIKGRELEYTNFGNMPEWAKDNPKLFWKMADEFERNNGSTYREHLISLPRELNKNQRLNLVKLWVSQELTQKLPYQYAIRNTIALDGKYQSYVHLMFCEREQDGIERGADQFFKRYNSKNPERGGAKKGNRQASWTERKIELKKLRDRWEKLCNKALKQAGKSERIDMRNWKERGEKEQPINIPKSMLKNPEIKRAYKRMLKSKIELTKAQEEVNKIFGYNVYLNN